MRWSRIGAALADGHIESAFVAWGESEEAALAALGAWTLQATRTLLDDLIVAARHGTPERRWWDAMRDDT
ncbi:MAG: hypothetical protein NVS1B4_17370 [Gemmatimonadaceae bacterium]